jgi:hypothetical protein
MNIALCWKEWREHRLIWLAVAALAVLLVAGLYATMAPPGGAPPDEGLRHSARSVLLVLAVAYGLVCGGMMFAGEREAGTQVFLDLLAGRRAPLWRTKVLFGLVLALTQTAVLVILAAAPDLAAGRSPDWPNLAGLAALLLLFALDAYAAGLVASTTCRTALGAAGLGTLFLAGSWLLTAAVVAVLAKAVPFFQSWPAFVLVLALASVGLGAASRGLYCRTDRQRRYAPARPAGRESVGYGGWRTLLWLAVRQGRAVIVGLAVGAPLLAAVLPVPGVFLWPVASLLIGLACGAAVFLPEQLGGSSRFLGNLRLPLGRVWVVKVLCWSGVAVAVGLLSFVAVVLHAERGGAHWSGQPTGGVPLVEWLRAHRVLGWLTPAGLFLPMWLLYGFATGLLCAQVFRKSVVAFLAALGLGAAYAGVWAPSLLLGGLHAWQVLGVPAILLIASRLAMRPWVAGRLLTWRPLLGLAGCGVLAVAWTAAGLWYRVAEVPDVGEPFDVRAFLASLPTPEQNRAGQLLRQAAHEFQEQERKVNATMGPPKKPLFPQKDPEPAPGEAAPAGGSAPGGSGGAGSASQAGTADYNQQAAEVVEKGWPEGEHELGKWLDRMFEGQWAEDYRAAAKAPLGIVLDPRNLSFATRMPEIQPSRDAARLFVARALQLQARGKHGEALEHLLTVLGLSRQVRSKAPAIAVLAGIAEEANALEGLRHWLARTSPRPELLGRALEGLTRHEEQVPPASEFVKVEHFGLRNSLDIPRRFLAGLKGEPAAPDDVLARLARDVPWERERERRLLDAITAGQLFLAEHPREWSAPRNAAGDTAQPSDRYARLAWEVGLSAAEGPTAVLGPRAWGKLLDSSEFAALLPASRNMLRATARSQCNVRAARLQVALALYQARHGRPAKSLEELVPHYLAALPHDPATGRPLHYRVSKGEKVPEADLTGDRNAEGSREVRPGQGMLWCEGPERRTFLVPLWSKR